MIALKRSVWRWAPKQSESRSKEEREKEGEIQTEMFGRVRAAPSTMGCSEMEKPLSKLFKDDSLSIYEATLMKLKMGSQHDLSSAADMLMETDEDCNSTIVLKCCSNSLSSHNSEASSLLESSHEEMMTMKTHKGCSSVSTSTSSCDFQSTGNMKEQQGRNMSILYLFSKFSNSGQGKSPSQSEVMLLENDGSSSSISSSSNNFAGRTKDQLEHGVSTRSLCPRY